jgi:hypothetical protein
MGVAEIVTADVITWVRERLKASARRGYKHKTLRKRTLGRSTVIDALRLVRMAFKEATLTDPRTATRHCSPSTPVFEKGRIGLCT